MYLVLPTTAAEVVRDASSVGGDYCQVNQAQLNNYKNRDLSKTTSAEAIAHLQELGVGCFLALGSDFRPIFFYINRKLIFRRGTYRSYFFKIRDISGLFLHFEVRNTSKNLEF